MPVPVPGVFTRTFGFSFGFLFEIRRILADLSSGGGGRCPDCVNDFAFLAFVASSANLPSSVF